MRTMRVSEHPEFDVNSPTEFPYWGRVVGDGARALALAVAKEVATACQLIGSPGWEGVWAQGYAAGAQRIIAALAEHAEMLAPEDSVV